MRTTCTTLLALSLFGLAVGCKREEPATTPEPQPVVSELKAVVVSKGDQEPVKPPVPKKPFGKFTISEATTFVTGPVDDTGHIDYAAALNERLSKGVTPENHANVLIWKAIGPTPFGPKGTPPGMFEKLGMPPPEGRYLLGVRRYMERYVERGSGEAGLALIQQIRQKPWKAKDHPSIEAWLQAEEQPLALAIEASRRTHYYNPLIPPLNHPNSPGLISALLPSVEATQHLADALCVRAMLALGEGKLDNAWRDLLACHRLARLLAQGGTLMETMIGLSLEELVCGNDLIFLEIGQPDAKQLAGYLRDLRELPPIPSVADKIDLSERMSVLDGLMWTQRRGSEALFQDAKKSGKMPNMSLLTAFFVGGFLDSFDWDPVFEKANKWFTRVAETLREPNRAIRVQKLEVVVTELRAMKDRGADKERATRRIKDGEDAGVVLSDGLGDIFVSLLFPAFDKVQNAHDRSTQKLANVLVAFALELHMWDNGKYPDSLDALAPKYLPKVPLDLFSGKPLIYKRDANSYQLYSVGPNETDDGGSDQQAADDIVVRMPSMPTR